MDMQPDNQSAAMPTLCGSGCGFYGSSATDGLCSKCFKDALKRKQDPNRPGTGASIFPTASSSSSLSSNATNEGNLSAEQNVSKNESSNLNTNCSNNNNNDKNNNSSGESTAAFDNSTQAPNCNSSSGKNSQLAASTAAPSPLPSVESQPQSSSAASGMVQQRHPDDTTTADAAAAEPQPPEKPRNRCHQCNRKVGLTGFECRCGGVYCGIHRYSDMHQCNFDYKTMGAEEIKKNNPVVAKEKIQKL